MSPAPVIPVDLTERARELLRKREVRITQPRLRVLAELLGAGEALSHLEVQRRLEQAPAAEPIDRVTLYRVLEWLVDIDLAHRVSGPDRVFRYSARSGGHALHGHFRCAICQRMFCLEEAPGMDRLIGAMLPAGFTGEHIELTVSGRCGHCPAPVTGAT